MSRQERSDATPDDTRMEELLDTLGARQREARRSELDETGGPGAAEEELRRRLLASAQGAHERRPARSRALLAVAAAMLVGGLWLMFDPLGRDVREQSELGLAEPRPISPVGMVENLARFEFDADIPAGHFARIVIYLEGSDEPVESPRLVDERSWSPPDAPGWDRLRWKVEIWSGSNQPRLVEQSRLVEAEVRP